MREAICMKAVNIKLSLAENVKTFVNIANRYPYDIDLRVGRTWWTASPFWVSSVWISPSRSRWKCMPTTVMT